MQIWTILIKSNLQALFLNHFTRENIMSFLQLLLIHFDADCTQPDSVGNTPLHMCVDSGHEDVSYCKPTFHSQRLYSWSTEEKLVCDDYFSWPHINHTRFDIALIQQNLIRGEKYSWQRGSRKSCKYFMHANKSWCTVFYFLQHSWIIWVQNNRLTVYFAARS